MMRRTGFVALLAALVCLAGCSQNELSPASLSTAVFTTPTPRPPLEIQVREAFRQPDPDLRHDQVLLAVDAFLRDEAIRQTDDAIASAYFNEVAFSSGRLTLPDPAVIQRQGSQAIVLLPEGMGLHLFDLALTDGVLELSRWTIGLTDLQVFWEDKDIGVRYTTNGRDDINRPHFVLATRDDIGWRLAWSSDETADWWFNADYGELSVAADLSELRLMGEAPDTTSDFFEQPGEPRRQYAIRWERHGDRYVMYPVLANYEDRSAWFQAAAVPSAYASLVAFVERIGVGDGEGAAGLIASADVLQAVSDFGLSDPSRRYQVVVYEENRIVFRDVQGTYIATFDPPLATGRPWLINRLAPLGAATPEPSATNENSSP